MRRWIGPAITILLVLAPAVPAELPNRAPAAILAEGGCPDGYEPYGVRIDKTGAAYLVCRDKKGGGLVFIPLATQNEATTDA